MSDSSTTARSDLKIALVCDWYLPRFGGLEMQLHDLALELTKHGHEVHVVTAIPGKSEIDGIRVHRLNVPLFPKYGFAYTPGTIRGIRAILRRESFDVVHCHVSYVSPTAFVAAYLSQRVGTPTAVTFHSFIGHFRKVLAALDLAFRWSRWPVVFAAVSDVVAAQFRSRIKSAQIHLVPNGVNPSDWQVGSPSRQSSEVHLVSVMRLKVRKRPQALIRIVRQVCRQLPDDVRLQVTIIGEGPEQRALERLISRYSLERTVTLMGYQPRDVIRDTLARADLFVLPTILESFGIAALEARFAGVPVVARVQSGISEFIRHGEEGLLADSDGEMVTQLIELIIDSGRRASIAEHNRSTPGPPTAWHHSVERHVALYRAAAEIARSRAGMDGSKSTLAGQVSSASRVAPKERSRL